jgi:hypothetical protein
MNTKPTATELALIAAALNRNRTTEAGELARDAYNLWVACGRELARHEPAQPARPGPSDVENIPFEDVMQAAMPSMSPADRFPRVKEYFAFEIGKQKYIKADAIPGIIIDVLKAKREDGVTPSERDSFLALFKQWNATRTSDKRKRASNSRWHPPKKTQRKKSL